MRTDAALVLAAMGYVAEVDFRAVQDAVDSVTVTWLAGTPMPSEAEIEAYVNPLAVIATKAAQAAKTQAASSIDRGATVSGDMRERIERCLVDIIRAEFNRHTDVEAAMFSAVAAATSLADLKTRYAAISQVPQRSLSDLVSAIKVALAATPE